MKTNIRILLGLALLLGLLAGCVTADFYPKEGEWYCEALQLQLSFDSQGDCFYIFRGDVIPCACGSDRGSRWLSVGCQDADSPHFDLGEEVFGGEFVRLDQDTLVVRGESDGREYTFCKVGGTQP